MMEIAMKKIAKKKIAKKSVSPLQVGKSVFVRTVTHYYTGHVVEISEHEIVLVDSAWIADTGRFSAALGTGVLSEVEPFHGPVSVGRGSVVDVSEWTHALPRSVK
jgi:hypothetical protein